MLLSILTLLAVPGDHAHLHPTDADLYISVPDAQGAIAAVETVGLWRLYKDPEITTLIGDAPDLLGGIPFLPVGDDEEDSFELSIKATTAYSLSVTGLDEFEAAPEFGGGGFNEMMAVLFEHEAMGVVEFKTPLHAQAAMALLATWASENIELTTEFGLGEAVETLHETPGGTLSVKDYEIAPGDSLHGLWVAKWGSYVAAGFGEAGAPGLLARLRGGENLANTDHWANGTAAMKEEGGTLYMTYHHNLIGDPWYALAAAEAGLPMKDLVFSVVELMFGGVLPMGASEKHGSCRIVDGEYVFETMDMGQTAAESTGALSDDFLGLVNPEAVGVWATTLDTEAVTRTGHELIAELIDIPAETIAIELEYAVGASLEELLAPLGEGVAFYMLPISGATIPRFHAVTKLEDSAAYEAAWTKLAEFLKTQGAEFVEVQDRPYRKIPVFSLKQTGSLGTPTDPTGPIAALGSMGVMSPAFTVAILPDRAVFGISPSYVKREVRRLLKADDEEGALHPLAENGAPCPAGVNYFGHLDWPEVIGGLYDTITAFLPLIADADSMPFDIDALPETETITRHFSATNVWTRVEESGTYTLKRAPVGFETGVSLAGLLTVGVLGIQGSFGSSDDTVLVADIPQTPGEAFEDLPEGETQEIEEEASVEDPILNGEEQRARQETQGTLQQVKLGLVIYKSEKGGFPGTLTDLLTPTQAYPRGFLRSNSLPLDGWGNPFQYATQTESAGYRLWSSGPDGVNNDGAGDDVLSS